MRRAILTLPLLLLAAAPNLAQAQLDNDDGLSPAMRRHFYNKDTAFVARVDLAKIDEATIDETIRGLFYDSSWPHVSQNVADLGKQISAQLTKINRLKAAGFANVTVIGIGSGPNVKLFFAERSNLEMMKKGLWGDAPPDDIEIEKIDFVDPVIHDKGVSLPSQDKYDADIERGCLLGLGQSRGASAVNAVVVVNDVVRAGMAPAAAGGENSDAVVKALAKATYVGGSAVLGDRPELTLYAQFATDGQASDVGDQYSRAAAEWIAKAAAYDEQEAKKETFTLVSAITWEEMARRISRGTAGKVFGRVYIVPMDTTDLRNITSALVDKFYVKSGE